MHKFDVGDPIQHFDGAIGIVVNRTSGYMTNQRQERVLSPAYEIVWVCDTDLSIKRRRTVSYLSTIHNIFFEHALRQVL